jgi:hypothetical protein
VHRRVTLLRRCAGFSQGGALYCVEMRPLLVATIQWLPQRTIESTLPTPGTVSPRVALQIPPGPSKTAVPPTTSRTVQPSIVVGFVSGVGAGLGTIFAAPCSTAAIAGPDETAFCRATDETGLLDAVAGGGAACDESGPRPTAVALAVGIFRMFGAVAVAS